MKIFKIVTDFDSNIFKKYLLSVFIIDVSCVIYFSFSQYFAEDIPTLIQVWYPTYLSHSVQLQHHLTQYVPIYLATLLSTIIMLVIYKSKSIFTLKYFFFCFIHWAYFSFCNLVDS